MIWVVVSERENRWNAAGNKYASGVFVTEMADDEDSLVRAQALRNPALPQAEMEGRLRDALDAINLDSSENTPSFKIVTAILDNPAATAAMISEILNLDCLTLDERNAFGPISNDAAELTRSIIGNGRCPEDLLEWGIASSVSHMNEAAAQNPNFTTEQALDLLFSSERPAKSPVGQGSILTAMGNNPNIPVEFLTGLIPRLDWLAASFLYDYVDEEGKATVMDMVLTSGQAMSRAWLAQRTSDPDLLHTYGLQPEHQVRLAVARNECANAKTISMLCHDSSAHVRWAAAISPLATTEDRIVVALLPRPGR